MSALNAPAPPVADALAETGRRHWLGIGTDKNEVEAYKAWLKSAEAGSKVGMTDLAYLYRHGRGTTRNPAEALRWYRKAAELGNPVALHALAEMLWKGEGVPVDEQEAARWWLKGAQAGHVTAMVDLAYTYREGRGNAKDLAEALRWYQAASNSSRDAQYQLGNMYNRGLGVPTNEGLAFAWFQKAAQAGHPTACYELASCYRVGRGTPVDLRKSFEFFDKAAQLGVPAAKYELGNYFWRGDRPDDKHDALRHWQDAAAKDYLPAMIDLARCLLAGDGTPKDPARALALFARGAERGNPVCMHGLAAMHYQGVGVPQSTTEALKWWRKAADAGLVAAQIDLAGALRKVGQAQAALRWYETVAEEGNPVAQHVCGSMYWMGEGAAKNEAKAVKWWTKAAEQDYPNAQYDLCVAFELGRGGLPADRSLALHWGAKAASHGLKPAQEKVRALMAAAKAPAVVAPPAAAAAAGVDQTIAQMLTNLNLAEYVPLFAQEKIDLDAAKLLTEDDLKELGLALGPRKKLLQALKSLTNSPEPSPAPAKRAESTGECIVCFEEGKPKCVFISCGHQSCLECGERVFKATKQCPICRSPIQSVLPIYAQ